VDPAKRSPDEYWDATQALIESVMTLKWLDSGNAPGHPAPRALTRLPGTIRVALEPRTPEATMAEQRPSKTGRFQRWRERRRAKAERTRGIHGRNKQAQAAGSHELDKRAGGAGNPPIGGF
jgi:hypothetical protein